jgi:hypothetical protein
MSRGQHTMEHAAAENAPIGGDATAYEGFLVL